VPGSGREIGAGEGGRLAGGPRGRGEARLLSSRVRGRRALSRFRMRDATRHDTRTGSPMTGGTLAARSP